jgi:hypothetical protein
VGRRRRVFSGLLGRLWQLRGLAGRSACPTGVAALIGLFGLEALEFAEGGVVGAVGGVDASLETEEGHVGALKGVADRRIFVQPEDRSHGMLPDLGVGFGQTAELPIIADEAIDVVALLGGLGTEAREVFGGEGFEMVAIFAADYEGHGVDAGFQGILGGGGLALNGARSSRFLSVEAVGLDLFQ